MSVKSVIEKIVETELVRRVEAIGGIAEKVRVVGRRGFVDRLVVLPGGIILFVEVKRPKGWRISHHQRKHHEAYKKRGCRVVILRDVSEIDALLFDALLSLP